MPEKRYYGKYRATVLNNQDPLVQARLMLQVPDVLGDMPTSWALPCLPAVGKQMGVFALPAMGSTVWAEFEQGNPDYPIWVGGYWGSAAEVPPLALAAPGPTGGIVLKSGGSMLIVNDSGIFLTNGTASVTLIGNTVAVNQTALTVM
jgi:uncharacterized protein involved in type VI secretion and phage assembly